MKNPTRVVAVCLAVVIGLFAGPNDGTLSAAEEHHASNKSINVSSPTPVSGLLDIILEGPFVVEKSASNITVLIPKVMNHTVPVVVDADFTKPKPLNAGDYSLDISNSTPGPAQINNPVAGTTIVDARGKSENLQSDPGKNRYSAITMPLPQEIVPWNADPMWVSTVPMPPQPSSIRGAVMLVLRYNFPAKTQLTFSGKESDGTPVSYTLNAVPVGSEYVLALVQGMKTEDIVDHPTAKDSFDKMKRLEKNLSRYIDFPDLGTNPPARNQPLIVDFVPKELTDFLTSDGSVSRNVARGKDDAFAEHPIIVHILLGHSDCRAPIIYVDYTQ
jgi:hypothetical protein